MPRDKAVDALHRLYVCHANMEAAVASQKATRRMLDEAIVLADKAGLSKAEIARAVNTSAPRIHQILATQED